MAYINELENQFNLLGKTITEVSFQKRSFQVQFYIGGCTIRLNELGPKAFVRLVTRLWHNGENKAHYASFVVRLGRTTEDYLFRRIVRLVFVFILETNQ